MELLQDASVWVAVSFAVFAVSFYMLGKGAILGKLDARIEEIRKEVEVSESLRIEAQELLAQYQRKQRDAKKEADNIVKTAKEHADQIKKQADKDLKEIMKRREKQLGERLKQMEEKAAQEIRAYAAELAVKATTEIIADKMDKAANDKLIDGSIKQVSKQLS